MKTIFISLLAVAALAGCSKSETQRPGQGQPSDGVIRVFAGVEAPTKAVVSQVTGVDGVAFRLIHAAAKPIDFSTASDMTGNIAAGSESAGGAVTFSAAPNYEQENDHNAWFIGYYPVGTVNGNVVTWTVDGTTDILLTEAVWDAGKYSAPKTTGMTFKHQLSQVEVVCHAVSGSAISAVRAAWGKIKSISFVDAPETLTFDYSDMNAAPLAANGATKALKALFADYEGAAITAFEIPESGDGDIRARAMLAPTAKLDNSTSFKLQVVTEGPTDEAGDDITAIVNVKIGASGAEDMVKGKTHKVTLTFQIDGQKIVADQTTIDKWEAGSEGSGDVSKPTPEP